jgi:hypothetical protein
MGAWFTPRVIIGLAGAVVLIIGGGLYGCPLYGVYQQRLSWEAKLDDRSLERFAPADCSNYLTDAGYA